MAILCFNHFIYELSVIALMCFNLLGFAFFSCWRLNVYREIQLDLQLLY